MPDADPGENGPIWAGPNWAGEEFHSVSGFPFPVETIVRNGKRETGNEKVTNTIYASVLRGRPKPRLPGVVGYCELFPFSRQGLPELSGTLPDIGPRPGYGLVGPVDLPYENPGPRTFKM